MGDSQESASTGQKQKSHSGSTKSTFGPGYTGDGMQEESKSKTRQKGSDRLLQAPKYDCYKPTLFLHGIQLSYFLTQNS